MREVNDTDKAPFMATLTGNRDITQSFSKKEYEIKDIFYMFNYLYVEVENDSGKPVMLRAHRFKVKTV